MQNKFDLNAPGVAAALSVQIKDDINSYCQSAYDDGHRKHLGASLIGDDCKRKLWYVFRWVLHEKHSGRQQRLFNRGHREEARFIEWLEGIGFKVTAHDENGNQLRIEGVNGHFGGSIDAEGYFPVSYNIETKVLFEFKTNKTGATFNKLFSDKLILAKPQHFAQTSLYGYKRGYSHVVYGNICKNDDELYIEVAKLDHNLGRQLEIKAEQIIGLQTPPQRLSSNPTTFNCAYCQFKGICHFDEPVLDKNCRSCKNAVPIENKQWACLAYNAIIPENEIKKGCGNWSSIANV